jgi:adenosylcobinamide-phosphate synthase
MILPDFLYPRDFAEFLLVLALAHLGDAVYPFHRGIALTLHPVHTSYVLAVKLGRRYSSKLRGMLTWLAVVLLHLATYGLALYLASRAHRLAWVAVSAYILKTSASLRLLLDIVRRCAECLALGDLDCARFWAQQIVRRDVSRLDEEHVASAAVESLAESLVDSYTSPLLYYALLGPLGALLQRLANTLDGALGFKYGGYEDVGWFSAKADTVLNYIPARLTALTLVLLAPAVGGDVHHAYRTWARFSRSTESVNAGHPMSAMAGVLGVRLEKVGHYSLGEPLRRLDHRAVRDGVRVALLCSAVWLLLVSTLGYLLGSYPRTR